VRQPEVERPASQHGSFALAQRLAKAALGGRA